jgi:hypothetical protein
MTKLQRQDMNAPTQIARFDAEKLGESRPDNKQK